MLALISSIVSVVGSVLEKFIGSKEEVKRIEKEVTLALLERASDLQKYQAEIVKAEIQGQSWLQRNWRPLLMLCFIVILANNYIIVPYLSAFTDKVRILEFPPQFWNLLLVGVGGYIAGRTLEKIRKAEVE